MKEFSCTWLPIAYPDIAMLDRMQFLHSDPFDRLLMAQAASRDVHLATLDRDILRTFERYNSFAAFAHQALEE
jgi:PIN domain nuclease of toxin-antitoxin system